MLKPQDVPDSWFLSWGFHTHDYATFYLDTDGGLQVCVSKEWAYWTMDSSRDCNADLFPRTIEDMETLLRMLGKTQKPNPSTGE